jgi:LysM repeat protein
MFVRIVLTTFVITALAWAVLVRSSDGAGPPRAYVVKPGDSLWSIAAEQYAGDPREGVWKLQKQNGLAGVTIRPGQRLFLP